MKNLTPSLFEVKYDILIENNKLIDANTGQEIFLKEGTQFQIKVHPSQILEKEENKKFKPIVAIPKGEILIFKIKEYEFHLELCEDLKMVDKNGKSKLDRVNCKVIKKFKNGIEEDFYSIKARSLNRAYTETYNRFYKEGSNNRYAYETYYYEGELLKNLKRAWEASLYNPENKVDDNS